MFKKFDTKVTKELKGSKVTYMTYLRHKTQQRAPLRDKVYQEKFGMSLLDQLNTMNANLNNMAVVNRKQVRSEEERKIFIQLHKKCGKYKYPRKKIEAPKEELIKNDELMRRAESEHRDRTLEKILRQMLKKEFQNYVRQPTQSYCSGSSFLSESGRFAGETHAVLQLGGGGGHQGEHRPEEGGAGV